MGCVDIAPPLFFLTMQGDFLAYTPSKPVVFVYICITAYVNQHGSGKGASR